VLRKWKGYKKSAELKQDADLRNSVLFTRMDEALSGGAAVYRALRLWGYQFMTMPVTDLTTADVIEFNAYGGEKVVGLSVPKVLRVAVQHQAMNDGDGIDILMAWFNEIFGKFPQHAELLVCKSPLRALSPADEHLNEFLNGAARAKYAALFTQHLSLVQKKFLEGMMEAIAFLEPHVIYTEIALLCSTSLSKGALVLEPQPDDVVDVQSDDSAGASSDVPTPPSDEAAATDRTTPRGVGEFFSAVKARFAGGVNLKLTLSKTRSALDTIKDVHNFMRHVGRGPHGVTLAQFCSFPEQKFTDFTENEIEEHLPEVNESLRMFCTVVKGRQLQRLQHLLQHDFLDPFADILDNKLVNAFLDIIGDLDDTELREKAVENPAELQRRISKNMKEYEETQLLHADLRAMAKKLAIKLDNDGLGVCAGLSELELRDLMEHVDLYARQHEERSARTAGADTQQSEVDPREVELATLRRNLDAAKAENVRLRKLLGRGN